MRRLLFASLLFSGCPAPSEPPTDADALDGGADGAEVDAGRDAGPPADAAADGDESDAAVDCTEPDRDGDGADAIECGGPDCDDGDAAIGPARTEVCDASDVDEDCSATTFGTRDVDGDGHVDATCCNVATDGTRRCGGDCDDSRVNVNPGAVETCDMRNNDCDLGTDEGVLLPFYPDLDGDDFGDEMGTAVLACSAPPMHAGNDTDCDDDDAGRNPGLAEVCDGVDNDCDRVLDGPGEDDDGDGFTDDSCGGTAGTDCDDEEPSIHDGAAELCDRMWDPLESTCRHASLSIL